MKISILASKIQEDVLTMIFWVSALLRVLLGYVNNGQANDNQLEVSELILKLGHLPKSLDCWQCYHVKLYHYTVAKLWKIWDIGIGQNRNIVAQELNVIAGILTIFIILKYLKTTSFNIKSKIIVFALVALNPRLIAISCTATNDAFIIFFGTAIIYFCYKLVDGFSFKYIFYLILFSILAGLTKTSSFVLICGVYCVLISSLLIHLFQRKKYKKQVIALFVYSITVFIGLYELGDFKENKKLYGDYLVYNTPLGKIPNFIQKTDFRRPGIQSIVHGYFTFYYFDMLKTPYINNDVKPNSIHRTSWLSQLYGRANFVYFDYLEPFWICKSEKILNVGRLALALGLIPMIILLFGLWLELVFWTKKLKLREISIFLVNRNWVFVYFFIGFFLFDILFTIRGRDFSFLKLIYILPGVLAIIHAMLSSTSKICSWISKSKVMNSIFLSSVFVLIVCYVVPILHLIFKLSKL